MLISNSIVGPDAPILITGGGGFIGARLLDLLLDYGFRNLRCFTRLGTEMTRVNAVINRFGDGTRVTILKGNLLSKEDCVAATKDVAIIFHLAAGSGEKSFPDAFLNTVVTTRNLLEASLRHQCLQRFVNISSFAVYSNIQNPRWRVLDETSPVEKHPELRGDAYGFAKVKQDEIVEEYGRNFRMPYVIVRPGYVLGPGKRDITSRVGIGTFGVFLHLGGFNSIPFTFVDNCAEAIALAGLKEGVEGEVFNVVDDDLPPSRQFLRLYKQEVRPFRSIYVPHAMSWLLCYLWEIFSNWSEGQLPLSFNCRKWHALWKMTRYSNKKIKDRLGWMPRVSMAEGLDRYFQGCRERGHGA
jgi:nucleoside-diphosphate-sugar epimerase